MSKAISYDNWYNKPNSLTNKPITNINLITSINGLNIISIKEFHELEYKNYLKILTNDVIRINFPIDLKHLTNDVVNIYFPNYIDLTEVKEYIPIEVNEFSEEKLINMLNYKTQYLFDVINCYDKHISEHPNKHNILNEVFKLTHSINTRYSKDKLNAWVENFPNFIDNKIRAIKNKQKDTLKQIQARKRYKNSELRFLNIIKKINNLGYYGFEESEIKPKMKYLEDDEIIQELIQSLSDAFGNDHDLLEVIEVTHDYEEHYKEREKEQFIDYILKNNINWRVC